MSETVVQAGMIQGEQRKKRVLTDARKAQNRLAQRAFRQRQKDIAKAAQGVKGSSHRLHELRPRQPRLLDEVDNRSGVASGNLVPDSTQDQSPNTTESQPGIDVDQEQVHLLQEPTVSRSIPWSEVPAETLSPDDVYEATLSTARFIADVDTAVDKHPPFGLLDIPFTDFGAYSSLEIGASPLAADYSSGPVAYDTPGTVFDPIAQSIPVSSFQIEDTQISFLGQPPLPPGIDTLDSYQDPSTSHHYLTTPSTFEGPSLLSQDFIPQNSTPQDPPTTPSSQHRHLATLTLWHSSSPSHPYPKPTIPSPYLNLLTPYQTSIISAFIHNARALSIARHELLTNAPLSPFYRATNTSTSTAALMAALPSNYPPHLRPTLPQVLFRHHAYLDLLPFPRLRERGVAWANTNPRLFDPRELKLDIVMGGLMCKRDEYGGGGGQPWDARSWTVAGWFKVKWRLLLC
ncbi:hypothetical protein BKA64DRAFT_106191 [Cadophora sp. MPI-SDFR-AT-0126]|nr:hypothetical protein BKA64DRAFT_106191 [Leotiomycetes sp. MPI-SDFR-AT-0126]